MSAADFPLTLNQPGILFVARCGFHYGVQYSVEKQAELLSGASWGQTVGYNIVLDDLSSFLTVGLCS